MQKLLEYIERALEAADHGLGLAAHAMDSATKARFVAAIYDLIGEDATAARNATRNATRILQLIEAMADHRGGDERTVSSRAPRRTPERGA